MENPLHQIRSSVRPLVIDSGIDEAPIGLWGTCFMATHRGQLFAVTAAHLVKKNHSGEIRILLSDGSMQRLPISQGIGALADAVDEEVDVMVYPASLLGLPRREARHARIINLDRPGLVNWRPAAHTSQFLVIGYPREHSEVDYEQGKALAGQAVLTGEYVGPVGWRGDMHQMRMDNSLLLKEFSGFSGSPVFAVEHRLAAEPVFRFCGVAVAGTATSEIMHFVGTTSLHQLMMAAIRHVGMFGLKLAKRIKKAAR